MKREFTKEQGIKIQQKHLAQWEIRLRPEWFKRLKTWAESTNDKAITGYDIRRGLDLSTHVWNYAEHY